MKNSTARKPSTIIPLTCIWLMSILAACGTVKEVVDPECTAEKAAQNVVLKSTVGVGNRCTPGEAVRDSTELDEKLSNAADALPN